MPGANPDFDQIASTTLKNYRPKFVDALTDNQALFFLLKQYDMWTEEGGGETLVQTLISGLNDSVTNYEGDEEYSIDPQDGIDSAEVHWKQKVVTIRINGFQEFVNQGAYRVLSLLEGKIKQAELSSALDEDEQLYGDGTADGGKVLTGLAAAVEDGTAWGTYAGIDSNIHTFWRNVFIPDVGNAQTFLEKRLRTAYNSASQGNDHPKLGVTDQSTYESFEESYTAQKTFDTMMLQAGFENFKFKQMAIVFDDNMDVGEFIGLNPRYIKYVIGKGRNFKTTEFRRLFNADARIAQIFAIRNLIVLNRRRHFRLTDIVNT